MKRLVALVGDFYHKKELASDSLHKALAEHIAASEIEVHLVSNPDQLIRELHNHPAAVVLFAEDRVAPIEQPDLKWMTPALSDQIVQYVENGGGWLAWHSGLASYPPDSSYTQMLRGYFLSHPEQNKQVSYAPADDGQQDRFSFVDEHYFVRCDEENTEVFLRSFSEDGESIAGWRHPYGAGRVSCVTPAHREEGLLHSEFLSLLRREISWIADI
ncbi:ThuA domain-containing protein [Paenibacillus sp. LHD-38]|uniref:ThuA domain-containing protein n=1 Tax=Paenibacillus sp. LHD-38 TaxID=3072143 RepID=UPI00280EEAB5|nr:ThuA domain-containing protein [Paenibacillus sp. LHD-38]MDQ8735823.1 ThuA domain-containing protein [Paenibacillus sp. LHD-38]